MTSVPDISPLTPDLDCDSTRCDNTVPVIFSNQSGTPIAAVSISKSKQVHIGTKIEANCVTYVDEDRKNKHKNNIMIILVVTLLAAILIILIIKNKSDVNNSGKTTPTQLPVTTTTTPGTSNVTETFPTSSTTTPTPQTAFIIPHYIWSIYENLTCINDTPAYTISLESINSTDCESSKDFLMSYEHKHTLEHNFYMSGDGYIYEGYGWLCSSEYNTKHSQALIKIAFFCKGQNSQINNLKQLIADGINKNTINKNYNILPECCRNNKNITINDEILEYLINDGKKSFLNPGCLEHNPQCKLSNL